VGLVGLGCLTGFEVGTEENGSRVARMPTLSTMRLSRRWGTRSATDLDLGHPPLIFDLSSGLYMLTESIVLPRVHPPY
jgi:hypothetical protein